MPDLTCEAAVDLQEAAADLQEVPEAAVKLPELPGSQPTWQRHMLQCITELSEQLRTLTKMPGQLETLSEAVESLSSRIESSQLRSPQDGSECSEVPLMVSELPGASLGSPQPKIGGSRGVGIGGGGVRCSNVSELSGFPGGFGGASGGFGAGRKASTLLGNRNSTLIGNRKASVALAQRNSRIPTTIPTRMQSLMCIPHRPSTSTGGFIPVEPDTSPPPVGSPATSPLASSQSMASSSWQANLPIMPGMKSTNSHLRNTRSDGSVFSSFGRLSIGGSSSRSPRSSKFSLDSIYSFVKGHQNPKTQADNPTALRLSRHVCARQTTTTKLKVAGSYETFEEPDEDRLWFVLMPHSFVRLAIDLLAIAAILLTGFTIPILVAYFGLDLAAHTSFLVILGAADAVWLLHICANFVTAISLRGEWIVSVWGIATAYVRRGFLLDALVACPIMIFHLNSIANRALVGLLLATKMLRLMRWGPLLAKFQERCRHPSLLGLRVVLVFGTLVNALSCCWRLAQIADGALFEPGVTLGDIYVRDMYWLIMTFTSVGYGDIVPQGVVGRVFAIMAMLGSPVFFGCIISLLGHGVKRIFDDKAELKVAQAVQFMQKRSVPRTLQRRVELNFRHHITKEHQMTMAPDLFRNLSPAVQRELSLELLRSTVLAFPLFWNCPRAFVAEIAQAHSWVQCLPWDLVVEQGQLLQDLVFIIQGRLIIQVFSTDGSYDAKPAVTNMEQPWQPNFDEEQCLEDEQELEAGAWFGEKCLFEADRVRTATGLAATEAELAVLSSTDFHKIISKYPPLMEMHRQLTSAISNGGLSLKELEYAPPVAPVGGGRKSPVSFYQRARKSKVAPANVFAGLM